MTATAHLPIVDIAPLAGDDAERRRATARDMRRAFEDTGFLYVVGHGVPDAVLAAAFAASREFHALPLERKLALRMNAFHRGYMPMASSTIVTSSVARVTRPNLSESLMVMHELPPYDPGLLSGAPLQGPNQWPEGLPGFRAAIMACNAALEAVARRLVRAVALGLELPETFFDASFARPTTWLRLLHYPPSPPQAPHDQFGSAPHTDYGFLTVLAQDRSGGLEVRRRDGTWLPAPPIDGSFVVNVADMLMRWSNGILPSTPHRVRNLSGGDRYSIPFFFDPAMDTEVAPLPACVPAGAASRFAPVRFGDYVMQRLDRNYAYRQGV